MPKASYEDDAADAFPFWTRGEVTQIAVVSALAVIPVAVAYADHRGPAVEPATLIRQLPETVAQSPGLLRAVRVTTFPVATMLPSTFADRDEP